MNCVHLLSRSLLCRVNESKADHDRMGFDISFKLCHLQVTELVRVFLDGGVPHKDRHVCRLGLWLPGEREREKEKRQEETRTGMKGLSQEVKINSS